LSVFSASSYFDARYLNGKLREGNENQSLKGNRLETVPEWISRNGIQFNYKLFTAVFQHSYVAESFSDAVNTVQPSANGAKGKVPAYTILDLNMSYRFSAHYLLKFGINNLANRQYFTKRPAGYPGQGVWSSDGRSLVVSFGIRL
jgi:Fe(3+) dicitrate transport protein